MNSENRWVKKAETIPWDAIAERYAKLFPSKKVMLVKPLRTALGFLRIQKQLGFSDREPVEEITENPYLQYFIGLLGFQAVVPFVPALRVEFCKCLNDAYIIATVLGVSVYFLMLFIAKDEVFMILCNSLKTKKWRF